jgi:hypothetical protein
MRIPARTLRRLQSAGKPPNIDNQQEGPRLGRQSDIGMDMNSRTSLRLLISLSLGALLSCSLVLRSGPMEGDGAADPGGEWEDEVQADEVGADIDGEDTLEEEEPHAAGWARSYGGAGDEQAFGIVETPDGYVVAGYTESFGHGRQALVFKIDRDGAVLWAREFGGDEEDAARNVAAAPDGFIVAGTTASAGAGDMDVFVVRFDNDGNIIWQRAYGGSMMDLVFDVDAMPDGGCMVAGHTQSFGAEGYDAWIMKLENTGNVAWQYRYSGDISERVFSISCARGDACMAAGSMEVSGRDDDILLFKLDPGGGILWKGLLGGAGEDMALSIGSTAGGGFVVAGHTASLGQGAWDLWMAGFDGVPAQVWQGTFGGASGDGAISIQETGDGGSIVCGKTLSFGQGGSDLLVLKLIEDGPVEWVRSYGGTQDECGGPDNHLAYSCIETGDHGYALVGTTRSFGAGAEDIWILKLDPEGTVAPDCPEGFGDAIASGLGVEALASFDPDLVATATEASISDAGFIINDAALTVHAQCGP